MPTKPTRTSAPYVTALLQRRQVRYLLAGGSIAGLFLVLMTVQTQLLGVPAQVALILSYCVAIPTHFALQRYFVFASDNDFALATHHQAVRFVSVALTQYALTAIGLHVLTHVAHLPTMAAYCVTAPVTILLTFTLLRRWAFHAEDPAHRTPCRNRDERASGRD
jgi:putative flippase GtrA